ncbi:hypothetical protein ANN_01739 [Periplaneta americana]|uniref:Uncharacterized protein n=1 Tax=Periplaneta americana TaxID=6978 RepID=A0ABQ8TXT0_PERAM|nr:hypothetical protein ANN_01739 [Periplaneta americana]
MIPGSSTESYPTFAHIGLRENPGKNLNQMAGGQDPKWQKDAADQNFDYMFKLLIIGNSSVGKTSFLFRYADDSFTSAFVSTVGIDFKVKTVFRHDKRVKLQIWVRNDDDDDDDDHDDDDDDKVNTCNTDRAV